MNELTRREHVTQFVRRLVTYQSVITYFGGNSELRGYDYLSFIGQNAFYGNAELRFPLIEAMATPIGVLGGVRATLFAGAGGACGCSRPRWSITTWVSGFRCATAMVCSNRPHARMFTGKPHFAAVFRTLVTPGSAASEIGRAHV